MAPQASPLPPCKNDFSVMFFSLFFFLYISLLLCCLCCLFLLFIHFLFCVLLVFCLKDGNLWSCVVFSCGHNVFINCVCHIFKIQCCNSTWCLQQKGFRALCLLLERVDTSSSHCNTWLTMHFSRLPAFLLYFLFQKKKKKKLCLHIYDRRAGYLQGVHLAVGRNDMWCCKERPCWFTEMLLSL
jgi:hypothetical protein